MQKGFSRVDYSDGRLVPHKGKKPIAPHLRPDYWPQKEKEHIAPIVKIRRGGKIVSAISLGDDGDLLGLIQNV